MDLKIFFSRPLSGLRWSLVFGFLFLGMVCGCSSKPSEESRVDAPLVDGKYKLSADREALKEIRDQVPEEKRQANDEAAFFLQWMGEVKRPPAEIREKFNSAVSKKRELFQKDMDRRREEYVKKERKDREDFQKEQTRTREAFVAVKKSSDERKTFFEELETKRKDFYADSREKRDAFESDMRDRRKNFDDYMREKNSEFNQEHRVYTKRYDDMKKEKEEKEKKKNAPQPSSPEDFGALNRVPSEPLGSGE